MDEEKHTSSEPKLYRKPTLLLKKRGSRKNAGSGGVQPEASSGSGDAAEDASHYALSRKSSEGGSLASPVSVSGDSGDPDEDRQLRHRLQRQKAQSRKTFRFRKSRRGAGFMTEKDADPTESIPLTSAPSKVIEEDRGTTPPIPSYDSAAALSPPADLADECTALLRKDDASGKQATAKQKTASQSSLLMVFPYVDEDCDDTYL